MSYLARWMPQAQGELSCSLDATGSRRTIVIVGCHRFKLSYRDRRMSQAQGELS